MKEKVHSGSTPVQRQNRAVLEHIKYAYRIDTVYITCRYLMYAYAYDMKNEVLLAVHVAVAGYLFSFRSSLFFELRICIYYFWLYVYDELYSL